MIARPTVIRREYINACGERWELRIDLETEVGELRGDELGDAAVQILDDEVQTDVMLGDDEAYWLAEC